MNTIYRVQHIGQSIGIATITDNGTSKEVHWIVLHNQIICQQNITQILISSTSHYNWTYPLSISDITIIQDLLIRTIPNYVANGQANYNWLAI